MTHAVSIAVIRVQERKHMRAGEARVWALLMVGVAYWANLLRNSGQNDVVTFASMIDRVLDNGAFAVFAWALIFVRSTSIADNVAASWRRIASTILLGVIVAVPFRLASAVALASLGGLLLADRHSLRGGRQVGWILLALAFETIWTSPFLAPLHVLVGGFDARVTAALLGLMNQTAATNANVVDNISANFSVVIWPYCTSSLPLAGVGLAFVTIIVYCSQPFRISYFWWLGLSFLASIVLTELRLVLLATGDANYQWWHAGPGVSIHALAALGLAVVFPIMAMSRAGEAPGEAGGPRVA